MFCCNNIIHLYYLSQADAILNILAPLIKDQENQSPADEDPEDFAEEQGLMAR